MTLNASSFPFWRGWSAAALRVREESLRATKACRKYRWRWKFAVARRRRYWLEPPTKAVLRQAPTKTWCAACDASPHRESEGRADMRASRLQRLRNSGAARNPRLLRGGDINGLRRWW